MAINIRVRIIVLPEKAIAFGRSSCRALLRMPPSPFRPRLFEFLYMRFCRAEVHLWVC
jgi:hypothetical protein